METREWFEIKQRSSGPTRKLRGIFAKNARRVIVGPSSGTEQITYIMQSTNHTPPDAVVRSFGGSSRRISPIPEAQIVKTLCGKEMSPPSVKISHARSCKSCKSVDLDVHEDAARTLDSPTPYLPHSAAIPKPRGRERSVSHYHPLPTPAEIAEKNGPITVRHENVLHMEVPEKEEPIVVEPQEKPTVPYLKMVLNENTDEMVARLNDLQDDAMGLAVRAEAAAEAVSSMKGLFEEREALEAQMVALEARIREGGRS